MDRERTARWSITATLVFGYMHILDELYGNWDFGGTIASGTQAAIQGILPLVLGLWALTWILQEKEWGHAPGLLLGVFMTYAGSSHFVGDTPAMTGFQTAVVALLVVSAVSTVVACGKALWEDRPWSGGAAASS